MATLLQISIFGSAHSSFLLSSLLLHCLVHRAALISHLSCCCIMSTTATTTSTTTSDQTLHECHCPADTSCASVRQLWDVDALLLWLCRLPVDMVEKHRHQAARNKVNKQTHTYTHTYTHAHTDTHTSTSTEKLIASSPFIVCVVCCVVVFPVSFTPD